MFDVGVVFIFFLFGKKKIVYLYILFCIFEFGMVLKKNMVGIVIDEGYVWIYGIYVLYMYIVVW